MPFKTPFEQYRHSKQVPAGGMASTVSKKRKASTTAFYAVKFGRVPGVYTDWSDCQAQTTGFKNMNYKKFDTRKDAEDYVAGKAVAGLSNGKPPRFYGVAVGHIPGVYTEWSEAQEQITDIKGPKYRKFDTKAEAEAFVKSGGKHTALKGEEESEEPSAKKAKLDKKVKSDRSGGSGGSGVLKIWTDGSCRGNGKSGACAGLGVYFGYDDERNLAARLPGHPQTNQRAELSAILEALKIVPLTQSVEIITDSNYSINCVTLWYKKWQTSAWKNSLGNDVVNEDLIKGVRVWIEKRDKKGSKTEFTWVKGHASDEGNIGADLLAVEGSRMEEA